MENIFVEFLPPWVETGLQPAFYDKESGTVLQQTARMYARVNMLIRMFNKLSKNTKEEVERFEKYVTDTVNDYIERFNTLYNYVHDYFDNLDVQEEINHKLDQMVEDGVIQDILLNYATVSKVYNTTREMIDDGANLVVGEKIRTLGYYTLNDGGGAEFVISDTTSAYDYQITLDTDKYASLISTNINVDQLGANGGNNALSEYFDTLEEAQNVYPNATDLTEIVGGVAIQCAINYYHDNEISLSAGTYYTNVELSNGAFNRIHLVGDSKWKSVIKKTNQTESESNILLLNASANRCVIENIDFVGPYEPTDTLQATLESYQSNGINLDYSSYNTVRNCVFRQCRAGIKVAYSWTNTFEDCYLVRCNYGIGMEGGEQNCIEINHCFAEYNNIGFYLGQGRSQTLINCNIEHNNVDGIRKTNNGDVQVIGCYFEDHFRSYWGQTYARNILIQGCSFYQNSSNTDFYTPIEFTGGEGVTQITVMNCNFIDGNADADVNSHSAVKQTNNLTTVPPVLINNTVVGMLEVLPVYMRGIQIHNGMLKEYHGRSFGSSYINGSDGGNTDLSINGNLSYRLNIPTSGTHTIKFPKVEDTDVFSQHQFQFIVPYTNQATALGSFSLTPADGTVSVNGHTSVTISDKNKLITATFIGNFNSKSNWEISVSA